MAFTFIDLEKLKNEQILSDLYEAKENNWIISDVFEKLKKNHLNLYKPTDWILRIFFFFLTLLAIFASVGSFGFLFSVVMFDSFRVLALITSIFVFLFLIKGYNTKLNYGTGIDEALLYTVISMILFLLLYDNNFEVHFYNSHLSEMIYTFVIGIVCAIFSFLFLDRMLMLISFLSFAASYFYLIEFIDFSILYYLDSIIGVLILIALHYFVNIKRQKNKYTGYYKMNLFFDYLILIAIYVLCNALFLFELKTDFYSQFDSIEFRKSTYLMIFKGLTFLIPMFYIHRGMQTKSLLWFNSGIGCFIVSILILVADYSQKYTPASVMIAVGLIIIVLSFLFNTFRLKKMPYISHQPSKTPFFFNTIFKSLTVSNINDMQQPVAESESIEMGGGAFGGGGSSDSY